MAYTADAAANTGAARSEYLRNKAGNQFNSAAKSLLYGGDDRAATPVHHGRRSVPHAGQHNAAPFAVWDGQAPPGADSVQGGQVNKTYQARNIKKEGAGKISSTAHDADAYRAQLVQNANNMMTQKHKARGAAGLLGQHPATPAGLAAGQQQHQYHQQEQAPVYAGQGYEGEEAGEMPEPEHRYRY